MPNYVRWRDPGATYFFTLVTNRRQRILTTPGGRRALREAMVHVRHKWPFDMLPCVLLPDHLHCIWVLPPDDDDFPVRWSKIKERFTRLHLARGGSERAVTEQHRSQRRRRVWQPRYWEHQIRDERDYFQHRDYVHLNPVKHGYADNPADWPWSSFHRHVTLGWLDSKWPGSSPVELPEVRE